MLSVTLEEWQKAVPSILEALERSDGTHSVGDVYSEIASGQKQLWVEGESAVVTQICPYPQMLSIELFLIGGELKEIKSIVQEILDRAKVCGIKRAQMGGRSGFTRALGFKELGAFMTKEI